MKDTIRFTETNSSDDSKGRTWGLEGELFWFVVGGGFAFVMILLLCFSALKMSIVTSVALGTAPLVLCLIYVFGFRQGKPAGHDIDCVDYWLRGAGFGPDLQSQPKHPLCLTNLPMATSSTT
jgi:hypothetical protein